MTLKVSALTTVLEVAAGDRPVTDIARLATMDGAGSDECFSDYLLDDPQTRELPSRGVSGGYLRFRFLADKKQLWAETEYDLRERLTNAEIESLTAYTLGQWSDGIGENFFPEYAEQTGLFLSPHTENAITQVA